MTTNEKIEDKIRKLLRLSEGTCYPEEAAAALGKAQALMEEHKIRRASLDVSDEPVKVWADKPLNGESRVAATWKLILSGALCKANGCFHYLSSGQIILVGTEENVNTIHYLYEYCVRQTDRLTTRLAAGKGRPYINDFRTGCAMAVKAAIEREINQKRNELHAAACQSNDKRDLMVLDKAIARVNQEHARAEAFARSQMRLRAGSSRSSRASSGRAAGERAGGSIYPGAGAKGLNGRQLRVN